MNYLTESQRLSYETALSQLAQRYIEFGAKSPKKVEPVHKWIAAFIKDRCPSLDIRCASPEFGNKEYLVSGEFYPKKCDVTLLKNDKVVAVVSFRAPWTNYQQNQYNLFESSLGDSVNIQHTGVDFYALMVLPEKMPHNNKYGETQKWETLSDSNIDKFRKLVQTDKEKPKGIALTVVTLNEARNEVKLANVETLPLSADNKSALLNELSIDTFMEKLVKSLV